MVKVFDIGPNDAALFNAEIVKTPSAFVRVHSPMCGHCVSMNSEWRKLLGMLKNQYSGSMGVFDIDFNALRNTNHKDLQTVRGFPTIMAIHPDKPPESYQGDRTTDDMLNFTLENFDITQGKPKPKRKGKKSTKKGKKKKGKKKKKGTRKKKGTKKGGKKRS